LLGGDLEIGDYTAAVARQSPENNNRRMIFSARSAKQQLNNKRGTVFTVLSVARCYKQDNCSTELVLGQSPAGKNLSTETKDIVGIRQQATTNEESRLRILSTYCTELQNVSFLDSATDTSSYDLQVFNISKY
jgi:hypothetical protein